MPSIMPPLPSGAKAEDFVPQKPFVPKPKPSLPSEGFSSELAGQVPSSIVPPRPVESVIKPVEEKMSALPIRMPTKLPNVPRAVAKPVQEKPIAKAPVSIRNVNMVKEGNLSDTRFAATAAIVALVSAVVLAAALFEKLPFF